MPCSPRLPASRTHTDTWMILRSLPDISRIVYRGIDTDDPRYHGPPLTDYKMSAKIHWSGFSSTSESADVAQRFENGEGVVFKLKVLNAKNVQPFSWMRDAEGEMLLNPNMEFVVTKAAHTPTEQELSEEEKLLAGCSVIEMMQCDGDATLWS